MLMLLHSMHWGIICMAAGRALGDARQPQKAPKPQQVMDDGPPLAPRRPALPPQLSPAKPDLAPPKLAHRCPPEGALLTPIHLLKSLLPFSKH
jgi:hypothetical protein